MSGIAGAFDRHGRPIDDKVFDRVVSAIAYRGPHGIRTWRAAGVAMAFARHARTDDAWFDTQPVEDAEAGTCVTFDGRLDNREELATRLGVRLAGDIPDVSLVGAAYRRWGSDCVAQLLGDFSLAVWNGRARRLLLARDIMAMRPLFYREWNGVLWWASDQRALVALDRPVVNEGYLGEVLSGRVVSIDETVYRGVCRLPMAHVLEAGASLPRSRRYWRPDPDRFVVHRGHDPREAFRTILADAVRARLRMRGDAVLMLSGGIDSTAVAATVAGLRDDGHRGASRITTLSMTVPGSAACEGPVIRQVVERLALQSEERPAATVSGDCFEAEARQTLDLPHPPSSGAGAGLYHAAIESGRDVVLTGCGGDEWFEPSFGDLMGLARRGRAVASARWIAGMRHARPQLSAAAIVRHGCWMATPDAMKQAVRGVLRRDPVPFWIDPAFAKAHDLADRLRARPDVVELGSLAQYDIFSAATGGEAVLQADRDERHLAWLGLEARHPLLDRRMVEFALSLPATARFNGRVTKAVMREAFSGILPDAVTTTPPNVDFGFLGRRVLDDLGGRDRVLASATVKRQWLSPRAVRELYRRLESGATPALWPLCMAMTIDYWLQALEWQMRPARHDEQAACQAGA